jgi:hypothetical protein
MILFAAGDDHLERGINLAKKAFFGHLESGIPFFLDMAQMQELLGKNFNCSFLGI